MMSRSTQGQVHLIQTHHSFIRAIASVVVLHNDWMNIARAWQPQPHRLRKEITLASIRHWLLVHCTGRLWHYVTDFCVTLPKCTLRLKIVLTNAPLHNYSFGVDSHLANGFPPVLEKFWGQFVEWLQRYSWSARLPMFLHGFDRRRHEIISHGILCIISHKQAQLARCIAWCIMNKCAAIQATLTQDLCVDDDHETSVCIYRNTRKHTPILSRGFRGLIPRTHSSLETWSQPFGAGIGESMLRIFDIPELAVFLKCSIHIEITVS